jgi:hypothetical protein
LMIKDDPVIFKLAPDLLGVIFFAVILSFGPAALIICLVYNMDLIYGAILAAGSFAIWLSLATIRIKVYSNRIERFVFWRRTWGANIRNISFRSGLCGDMPIIPSIDFIDQESGNKIGYLLKHQFKKKDLNKFLNIIESTGALRL